MPIHDGSTFAADRATPFLITAGNVAPTGPSHLARVTSSSTTSLQGGRYVAPGVYVGAQQGASTDSSRGVVEIEVFKHTKLQGAIGTDSNDKIGAKMEWDY